MGYVFDATSLDPVIGAKVTLYETSGKDAKGNFKWIVYDPLKHTGSTVKNPYITTATDPGRYSFFTEDGYYKLVVSPPAVSKIENVNKGYSAMYSDIYPALTGEIIHEEGAVEHRDVPVNSTNVASSVVVIEYTPSIVNIGEVELYGRLSHPFSKLTVMTDKLMADGTQVPYRAFDQFTADREGRFEYTVDQSTLERTDQYIEIFSYLNIEKPSAKTLSAKQSLLSKAVEYVKSLFETHAQTKTSTRIQMNPVIERVEGYAYDTTGAIIPNATVGLYVKYSENPSVTVKADETGYFEIDPEFVPSDPYDIRYTKPNGEIITVTTKQYLKQNFKYITKKNVAIYGQKSGSQDSKNATGSSIISGTQDQSSSQTTNGRSNGGGTNNDSSANMGITKQPLTEQQKKTNQFVLMFAFLIFLIVAGSIVVVMVLKKKGMEQTPLAPPQM